MSYVVSSDGIQRSARLTIEATFSFSLSRRQKYISIVVMSYPQANQY